MKSQSLYRVFFVVTAVFLIGLCSPILRAQTSGALTANSTASVIQGINLVGQKDLRFGIIIPDVLPGTVIINPVRARTKTGGPYLVNQGSTTQWGPAQFVVSGEPNTAYSITLPYNGIIIIVGMEMMDVDEWTSYPSSNTSLSASGTQTFYVGGTLHVEGNQHWGSYSGAFTVTVHY
ncbi:MAG: DUF4402 domain-containing protein [Bacteroidota bacterium]